MTTTFLAEFWTFVIDKKFAGVRAHSHHHNHHCHSHSQSPYENVSDHPRHSLEGQNAAKCHKRTNIHEDPLYAGLKPDKGYSPQPDGTGNKQHNQGSPGISNSGRNSPESMFNVNYDSSSIQKKNIFNRIFRRSASHSNNYCDCTDASGDCIQGSGKDGKRKLKGSEHSGIFNRRTRVSTSSCSCCSQTGSSYSEYTSDDSDIGSLFYLSSDDDSVNDLLPECFANETTVISLEKSEPPSAHSIFAAAKTLKPDTPCAQLNGKPLSTPPAALIKKELLQATIHTDNAKEESANQPVTVSTPVSDHDNATAILHTPIPDNSLKYEQPPAKSESDNYAGTSRPPADESPTLISAYGATNDATHAKNILAQDIKPTEVPGPYVYPQRDLVGNTAKDAGPEVSITEEKALTVKCHNIYENPPVLFSPAVIAPPGALPRSIKGAQLLKHIKRSYIVGKGATAVVKLCDTIDTDKKYAIKEFRKRKKCETKREYIKKLVAEFCISSSLINENVVSTIDLIQGEKHQWCVVMEYCPGGDLYTRIVSGTITSTPEINCYFKQLINGVNYLHSMGVAHRDLKPENLLLSGDGSMLKIADFGVSAVFRGPFCSNCRKTKGLCGSGPYISPEQFSQQEYDPRMADIWSTAIVYYVMVYNASPWKDATLLDQRFKKYCDNPANYPPIQRLRPGPRSLILKMLHPDVSERIKTDEILSHEWFKLISVCTENHDPNKPPNHEHYVIDHND